MEILLPIKMNLHMSTWPHMHHHVRISTGAELDRLGLTALRPMVDVEPYDSSDLGGNPSDNEPPSMTSALPPEVGGRIRRRGRRGALKDAGLRRLRQLQPPRSW